MLWPLLILMVGIVFLWVLLPLLNKARNRAGVGNSSVLAIYSHQLTEIELEKERGLISPSEAEGATLEVKRRLVRAYDKGEEVLFTGGILFPLIVTGLLLAGALIFYLKTGNPDLINNFTGAKPQTIEAGGEDIENILGKLDDHLKDKPDDLEAWVLMATSRLKQRKYYEAATAFGRAFDLSEDDEELLVSQGEALVNLSGGLMTPASNLVFGSAMTLNPNHPAPKYYLGLGRFQSGNIEGALRVWEDLLAESEEEAPWVPNLKNQIFKAQNELNGPSFSGVESMSPSEQEDFIESMISSLRAKLEENPNDLEGWLRLARSEIVKGRLELGLIALQKAEELAEGELKIQVGQEILKIKADQN